MVSVSKKRKEHIEMVDSNKSYDLNEALAIVKKTATAKFDESVDVAVNLGIDPKKSDQLVRGSVAMPKGTGKTVRIAVFAQGEKAKEAEEAGADVVGFEDLAAEVKAGKIDFDIAIATPDAMRVVGQLGQVLGPRGIMPNPKVGTVATDVGGAIAKVKGGQVQYRTDKAGIIHCSIGRASFAESDLVENFKALMEALIKAKPEGAKGLYLRKVAVSSTMGISVRVDYANLART